MDEPQIRYIEVIQQVIARMANNSFLIKGWTLTLVAAIFAVAAQSEFWGIVWVALLPTIAFWFLDAYYVRQERLFRHLYNSVIGQSPPALFQMDIRPFSALESFRKIAFSITIWPLHGVLLVCVIVVGLTKVCYAVKDSSAIAALNENLSVREGGGLHQDYVAAPPPIKSAVSSNVVLSPEVNPELPNSRASASASQ